LRSDLPAPLQELRNTCSGDHKSASHEADAYIEIELWTTRASELRLQRAVQCPAMAIFHLATISPTKAELIAEWAPTRPWGPSAADPIDVIGSYRFDDADGRVGMETHLLTAGGVLLQVPLTYRDKPLVGAEDAFITEMQHSVLGTRWVYDGLRDPQCVMMLAAVAMTGQGEALGMAVYDGRWYIAPSNVRIQGGGWTQERVPVDNFELESDEASASVLYNDRFELRVFRRPVPRPRPAIGLTANWDGDAAVVLAEVRER
jgi:hypothetical protein